VPQSKSKAPDPRAAARAQLLELKRQLEHSTSSAVAQGREVVTDDIQDPADQAVMSYQKEMLFRQGTSGAEQLALVEAALARVDEGTYGECQYCGEPIGAKRLAALPWTRSCIRCQERIERGEMDAAA